MWERFIDGHSHLFTPHPEYFFQYALNQSSDTPMAQGAGRQLEKRPRPYLRWLNKPEKWVRSPLLRTLVGHSGWVQSVAVSTDNRWVVSGSEDNTIKVWNLATGQNVATFSTKGEVLMCACRATGEIVAGDEIGEVYILRLEGG